MMTPVTPKKTKLSVVEKHYITPNYLSIVLTGDDVSSYADATLGANNKIFVPPVGHKTVVLPTHDPVLGWTVDDPALLPTVRTYTHRAIDLAKNTMTIDFAVHEGDSIACQWAVNAEVGDEIGVTMKAGKQKLMPEVGHYVFVTDPTGIPVTAALLERLPAGSQAVVIAEVPTAADHYPFQSAANLSVEWLYNPHPDQGSPLAEALKANQTILDWPVDARFAHITAEHGTVRAARNYLRKEQGWQREECYACAYWQIGRREGEMKGRKVIDD
ncbi:MAG: siderophore-interacting protein [Neisseriaceae bacterium]|nr:siderophore-interacting protein [Neisseriaceae bacterium]MBP6860986.1 siderophore-interacting protein [Neisseriaceae bacterium]